MNTEKNTAKMPADAVLADHYAEAIQLEKNAWQALQARTPGSGERAQAWATWMDAISKTNRAWRELSGCNLARASRGKTLLPNIADRFDARK